MAEVDVQLREAVRVLKKLTGRIVSQGSLQALGELSEALGVAKAKVDRHYVLRASTGQSQGTSSDRY